MTTRRRENNTSNNSIILSLLLRRRKRRLQLFGLCFVVTIFVWRNFVWIHTSNDDDEPYYNANIIIIPNIADYENNETKTTSLSKQQHPLLHRVIEVAVENNNNNSSSNNNNGSSSSDIAPFPESSSSSSSISPRSSHSSERRLPPQPQPSQPPLLIYIHFHKAGGTTMLIYMSKLGLKNIQTAREYFVATNKDKDDNIKLQGNTANSLMIYSTTTTTTKTSSSSSSNNTAGGGNISFWKSIQSYGVDFVSLEYNFITPTQFANLIEIKTTTTTTNNTSSKSSNNNNSNDNNNSNSIKFVTIMRDPWSRFRSTYERELSIICDKNHFANNAQKSRTKNYNINRTLLEIDCYNQNKMIDWMESLSKQFPRQNRWGGILRENYYVRMLNGINDQKLPIPKLYDYHLEYAKDVIRQFDLVVLLDDPLLKQKFDQFLFENNIGGINNNNNNSSNNNSNNNTDYLTTKISLPHHSNNKLKKWITYDIIQKDLEKHVRKQFEIRNTLDIQLYEYVQNEIATTTTTKTSRHLA